MTENSKAVADAQRLAGLWWPAMLLILSCPAAPSHAQTAIDAAPAAVPRWNLSVDAQEGYDDNVRFVAPGGAGDFVTRLGAKLDRTWAGRRGRFAVSGGGQGWRYRRISDLDRFTYAADADGSYLLSPRAVIRVTDALSTSYASELAALTGSGLLLPTVLSHANAARGSFSYSASRRTTATLDLRHETVSFDSPSLVGGSALTAGAGISRELSRADRASAAYQYQLWTVLGEHSAAHTLHATWNRSLGASAHARARLGASRFQPLMTSWSRTTPVGGAALDARWGRQAIEAQYDRFLDLAYGLGRVRINGLLSARYALSVTPELALDVRAIRARSLDPADASFELTDTNLVANLRYALARGFAVVASYSHRRSVQPPALPISSHGATVVFTYERPWP
jgi:hypothetical protein